MITSKPAQRLFGMLLLAYCGGCVVWDWHEALHNGDRGNIELNGLSAGLAVGGLGMILFPIDWEKLREEQGVVKVSRFAHMPGEWKVLFILAVVIGVANGIGISHFHRTTKTADSSSSREQRSPIARTSPPPFPPSARTFRDKLIVHVFTVLFVGGVCVLLFSAQASQIVKIFHFLEVEISLNLGRWMFWTGFGMITAALFLLAL